MIRTFNFIVTSRTHRVQNNSFPQKLSPKGRALFNMCHMSVLCLGMVFRFNILVQAFLVILLVKVLGKVYVFH